MKITTDDPVEFARHLLNEPASAPFATPEALVHVARSLEAATQDPDTNDHDALVALATAYLRTGEPLPCWLATFAADVIDGSRKRPTRRGPDKYGNFMRDARLARTAVEVARRFDMPLYGNNELSFKASACDMVAAASGIHAATVIAACRRFAMV